MAGPQIARDGATIDVRFVIAHGLWILGAAVALAAFSYYHMEGTRWWERKGLRRPLRVIWRT